LKEPVVPVSALTSLDDVLRQLRTVLGGNDLALGPVCTRVGLRTGINLKSPTPAQAQDPAAITKVLACLAELGYTL
jgi:hypothetical protein